MIRPPARLPVAIQVFAIALALPAFADAAPLHVPAFTAYFAPNPDAIQVSGRRATINWRDGKTKILWFGELKATGKLTAAVVVRLPKGEQRTLRLAALKQAREVAVVGTGEAVTVAFGAFDVAAPGYQRFTLEASRPGAGPVGDVEALVLDGPASASAHFNLERRRNAASVHMRYPIPADARVEWFYTEVTAIDDPPATFYMACGFRRGYFGMQVNSGTERRIIFSVWDAGAGASAKGRSQVDKDDQVSLVAKGKGVQASVFGGEGTGGHSHLVYAWKTGVAQRFLVTAQPSAGMSTIYSGYFYHPDQHAWMLIAGMKAPRDGGYLRGLHSFSEDFGGSTGHLRRKALYGNQWIRTANGTWTELTRATFSHDATGKSNRLDRFMGVDSNAFFLSHGGFVPGFSRFGASFNRPAGGRNPDIQLPRPPAN